MFDSKQFFHKNLLGIVHSTEFFTQPAVVMVVTNMRYVAIHLLVADLHSRPFFNLGQLGAYHTWLILGLGFIPNGPMYQANV